VPRSGEQGILEFRNLTFIRGGRNAEKILDKVTLVMRPGTVCSLVSMGAANFEPVAEMLLRTYTYPEYLIAGGEIWVAGVNTTAQPRDSVARTLKKGFAVSECAARSPVSHGRPKAGETLLEYLTRERPRYNPKIFNENLAELNFRDIRRLFNLPVLSLSYDDLQRIKLAQALAKPGDILTLIEPTMNLGRESKYYLQGLVRARLKDKSYKLALMLTEDPEFAGEISDQLCILERGRALECGSRDAVIASSRNKFLKNMLQYI
jgi:ABC-type multidrug transport system ATPase subunit